MIDFDAIKKYFYNYLNGKKVMDSLMNKENDYSIVYVDDNAIVFNSKIKQRYAMEHFLISLTVINDNTLQFSAIIKSPYDINMYNKVVPVLFNKFNKCGFEAKIENVNTLNRYLNNDYEKKMINICIDFDNCFFDKLDKLFFIINKYNEEIYDKLMLRFNSEIKISI